MDSEYSFQFTEKAEEDLDDVISYMTDTLGSPASASAFMDNVEETIEKLCLFPKSGPAVVNEYVKTSGIRRKAIGNSLLYYLPDEQKRILTVLRIIYGKRDADAILRELDYS